MRQQTISNASFGKFHKTTRKEAFLAKMDELIPWRELCDLIEPHYPKVRGAGRRPVGVERMLRIHLLQHWYELSDPAMEDALYDVPALRRFSGIDLGNERAPDETTICKFRHLIEKHDLGEKLFRAVNKYLVENGLRVSRGTIVDASIISAPSSTKNQGKARDPEMKQTKKGNQWYFGMKAHIGVDSRTRLIHSVTATNVHDSQVLEKLLHGGETQVWGDSAYAGQKERLSRTAPKAHNFTQAKGTRYRSLTKEDRSRNRTKSRVRVKMEHAFGIIKHRFGFTKVRYRGLKKNSNRLYVACALANIVMAERTLLARRRRRILQPQYA